jgi:succinate dehydrogenase/fumarate reductase flavoprotein subunit
MINSGSLLKGPREADVIVVGSGAAGFTAAVTARLLGLDVVLLEKAAVLGGITAVSGGGIWCPCSPTAQRAGVEDSLEAARAYFASVTGLNFDPHRADAFLTAGPQMIDLLERQAGLQFYVARDRPDYYDTVGSTTGTRTIFPTGVDARKLGAALRYLRPPAKETTFLGMMMRPASDLHHFLNVLRSLYSFRFVVHRLLLLLRDRIAHGRSMELAGGNALIAQLLIAAESAGVRIHTNAPAVRLRLDDGRVTGLVCKQGTEEILIQARVGVVLAAGGFPHDVARRQELFSHAPSGQEHLSPAPAENTGDGIRMGEEAGGLIPKLADAACWAPTSRVPYGNGRSGVFPHLIDRQKPGFIAVDTDGRRFVNESHSYHEFGRGLRRTGMGRHPLLCYLIADHPTVRRYGIGFAKPAPLPLRPYLRSGYLVREKSIRDLAYRIGVPGETLEATIRRFNEHAHSGDDPDYRRGSTAYNRYLGDKLNQPNPCLAPLITAPFYAVKLEMGELGTFEGLATDENARVLRSNGRPIAGLYAAGNDMSHVMGGHYLGGGAAIGPAMTFGYIAARHIAAQVAAVARSPAGRV